MAPVVAIAGLRHSFGATVALDGIDAAIEPGLITGLVGPDASGKTTLLRLMAGLLRPAGGSIRVLGFDMAANASAAHPFIGYMPQRFGLYEDLSVAENLDLHADMHTMPAVLRAQRVGRLLQFTGLAPFGDRLAGQLSGGMKQKLGLACALLSRPRLLLLDEPSVGVDPVSRRELWSMVTAMLAEGRDEGMAVVWATAYLDEAARCDRVLLLHQGRLLSDAPPATFLAPLEGRVFRLTVPISRRRAIARSAGNDPRVLDATVAGDELRIVLRDGAAVAAPQELGGTAMAPVAPRFEDGFIASIAASGHAEEPDPPSAGSPLPAPIAAPPGNALSANAPSGIAPSAPAQSGIAPPGTAPSETTPSAIAPSAPGRPGTAPSPAAPSETAPPETAEREPSIQVQDLVRRFGNFTAVDRITFSVAPGEIFGLLGPNGAGKSTTFRMLCGLLRPSAGQARVAGQDLLRAPAAARARIGYMAQRFSLYAELSVRENLRFFGRVYGLGRHALGRAMDQAQERFELTALADTQARDLPLGLKQRLALAAALMHGPEILFLDEPTSGVDPLTRRDFWTRIGMLADSGVTILVTSHFMDEAEYCDRLAIISQGRLAAIGSPSELRARARSESLPEPTLEDAFIALAA